MNSISSSLYNLNVEFENCEHILPGWTCKKRSSKASCSLNLFKNDKKIISKIWGHTKTRIVYYGHDDEALLEFITTLNIPNFHITHIKGIHSIYFDVLGLNYLFIDELTNMICGIPTSELGNFPEPLEDKLAAKLDTQEYCIYYTHFNKIDERILNMITEHDFKGVVIHGNVKDEIVYKLFEKMPSLKYVWIGYKEYTATSVEESVDYMLRIMEIHFAANSHKSIADRYYVAKKCNIKSAMH